jgi:ADP-ribosylglycohydrolase
MEEYHLEVIARYRGSLLGLAVGDALGVPLEFKKPGTFSPVNDLVGGGVFGLAAGQWTDDTSMALCLAESLVERRGFDAMDQLDRYLRWYLDGYLSSTGKCFAIGNTVREALERFAQTPNAYCGSNHPRSAGNGSIMRLAPVPLYYADNAQEAINKSGESSLTTHGTDLCVDACRYLGALIVGAVLGYPKAELLAASFELVPSIWQQSPLHPLIAQIATGSFKRRNPPEIQGSGYVVASLEAALWAFYHSNSFREGALLAVNLGDDADTTGAVYGQLAGAYYGEQGIPEQWQRQIYQRDLVINYGESLYTLHSNKCQKQELVEKCQI